MNDIDYCIDIVTADCIGIFLRHYESRVNSTAAAAVVGNAMLSVETQRCSHVLKRFIVSLSMYQLGTYLAQELAEVRDLPFETFSNC